MSPADLFKLVRELPAEIPAVDEIVCGLWPASCCRDERKHWMDWLLDHEMRNTAHAHRVWRNIQSPPMLIWLMAASGVGIDVLRAAAQSAAVHPRNSTQCRILREAVSWQLVRKNLTNRSPLQ